MKPKEILLTVGIVIAALTLLSFKAYSQENNYEKLKKALDKNRKKIVLNSPTDVDALIQIASLKEMYMGNRELVKLAEALLIELKDPKLENIYVRIAIEKGSAEATKLLLDLNYDADKLVQAVTMKKSSTAWQAVRAFGETKDPRLVEPIVKHLLKDETIDEQVRGRAAEALGKINNKSAVAPLIESLESDTSRLVRYHSAEALGKIASPEAVDPLIRALKYDKDAIVREHAAFALGEIKDSRVVEQLEFAAKEDKSGKVRSRARNALLDKRAREEQHVRWVATYDKYGRPVSVVLSNMDGKPVAKLEMTYKLGTRGFKSLVDISTGKVIYSDPFDASKKVIEKHDFLCLDDNGDIVRDKEGRPHQVKSFNAKQITRVKYRYQPYNNRLKAGADATIFNCGNCMENTGGLCSYIWK